MYLLGVSTFQPHFAFLQPRKKLFICWCFIFFWVCFSHILSPSLLLQNRPSTGNLVCEFSISLTCAFRWYRYFNPIVFHALQHMRHWLLKKGIGILIIIIFHKKSSLKTPALFFENEQKFHSDDKTNTEFVLSMLN